MSSRPVTSFMVWTIAIAVVLGCQGCEKINDLKSKYLDKDRSTAEQAVSPAQEQVAEPQSVPEPVRTNTTSNATLSGDVVARVGDWSITEPEFKQRLQALKDVLPDFNPDDEQTVKLILQEMVNQELLYQEAQRSGVAEKPEIAEQLTLFQDNVRLQGEELRRRLFVQEMAQRVINEVQVTDADAEEYYQDNKKAFITPVQYHIREIVVDSEDAAKEILAQIYQGVPFQDLVGRSKAKSAWEKDRGSLGYVSQFPFPKMGSVVEALDVGSVSSVFKGPEGFYVVKLEDKKGGDPQSFDDIKDDIKQGLQLLQQQQVLLRHLEELRGQTTVQIKEKYLLEE